MMLAFAAGLGAAAGGAGVVAYRGNIGYSSIHKWLNSYSKKKSEKN